MFSGIHDSLLYAYSVDSEREELVMLVKPHHGSAPSPFRVVFKGLVAHCFEAPQLPAILLSIDEEPAEDIIKENWPAIERGYKSCGWPGPWAETECGAVQFAKASTVRGYTVCSSFGLSGWVLAREVKVLTGVP